VFPVMTFITIYIDVFNMVLDGNVERLNSKEIALKHTKRGRPKSSYANKAEGDKLLSKVADKLVRMQANSPTEAIRQLIGEDQDSELRRLQRRWSREGDAFIKKAQEPFFRSKWEKEGKDLKEQLPDLYEKFHNFAISTGGKKLFLEMGDGVAPVHFMSLGVLKLNQLVTEHTLQGNEKAESAFEHQMKEWGKFGNDPDAEFLRTFAELCLKKAEGLDADISAENGS